MRKSLTAGERAASPSVALPSFLPQLAHELRTPVQVIAGFLDLLLAEQAGPLTHEQRRYLEQSRRSCQRLARFADELAAGDLAAAVSVRPQVASLARLAESVAASMKPLLDRRRQTLRVRIAPGAAQGWFDPERIEQVLQNLISNASEYGPEGGAIDVEAEAVAGLGGAELRVSVTDDGPGGCAAWQDAAPRPGRGLGLGICRAIVSAHGAQLTAEDAPPRGARIWFTLAAREEEAP